MRTATPSRLPTLACIVACCILLLAPVWMTGCSSEDQVKPLKPLRVATGNWKPFVGESLPHNGPLAEMISTILVDLGYVPEFKYFDWPMVEIHLETGYPGLAFPFIKSKEREAKGFRFSDPLHTFDYVLFYHRSRNKTAQSIRTLEDLAAKGLKIGRIRGYAKLSAIPNDENYIEVPNAVAGFKLLRRTVGSDEESSKKIDFLLESKTVGLDILAGQSIADDKDEFEYLGHKGRSALISKVSLRVMLSPKLDSTILPKINKAIGKAENKEFFDSLRARAGAAAQDTAYLAAPVGIAIFGYKDDSSDHESLMIPQHSKVLIVAWGLAYTGEAGEKNNLSDSGRSQVKLLSGPSKGKVVWVSNKHITLGH